MKRLTSSPARSYFFWFKFFSFTPCPPRVSRRSLFVPETPNKFDRRPRVCCVRTEELLFANARVGEFTAGSFWPARGYRGRVYYYRHRRLVVTRRKSDLFDVDELSNVYNCTLSDNRRCTFIVRFSLRGGALSETLMIVTFNDQRENSKLCFRQNVTHIKRRMRYDTATFSQRSDDAYQ